MAEIAELNANSSFDIMGVITEVTQPRQVQLKSQAATKMVMDVTVEDGSLKGDQQAALRIIEK